MNRKTAKEREQLLSSYKSSRKTQKVWCEENGINIHTLRNWCKSKAVKPPVNESSTDWIEVSLKSVEQSDPIKIEKGSFRISIPENHNPELLLRILKTMEQL